LSMFNQAPSPATAPRPRSASRCEQTLTSSPLLRHWPRPPHSCRQAAAGTGVQVIADRQCRCGLIASSWWRCRRVSVSTLRASRVLENGKPVLGPSVSPASALAGGCRPRDRREREHEGSPDPGAMYAARAFAATTQSSINDLPSSRSTSSNRLELPFTGSQPKIVSGAGEDPAPRIRHPYLRRGSHGGHADPAARV
jgi:hypothetical protein